jgi:prepilin-type N-terminal cleavage/methylation domain-containing protein
MPKQVRSSEAPSSLSPAKANGFSLLEMLVAITVTLIIMGSVYGLMSQGQSAFGREPYLADRQQQIRIAMGRIQEDTLSAGSGLGLFFQAFAPGLDNIGPQGVRPNLDTTLGGPNSDVLEIRRTSSDCPMVRTVPGTEIVGGALNTIESFPLCFPEPGYVFLRYPDGRSKFGWLTRQRSSGDDQANFVAAAQPGSSQIGPASDMACSVWIGNANGYVSPNGLACPAAATLVPPPPPVVPPPVAPCPLCQPYAVQQAEIVRYQIGTDTDGTVGLFRSVTGGVDANDVPQDPPHAVWQLVGSGIEDLQVEYRTTNSGAAWLDTPLLVQEGLPGNIVLEVRVTLWARAIAPAATRLAGETRSQGTDATGITAVRGSMVSIMAPRASQEVLATLGTWK